jgi:radical SAM superfamily enzyme YgiQ (UPF0313 family)
MKPFRQILLIRSNYTKRPNINHPLHNPPPLGLKYVKTLLEKRSNTDTVPIIDALVQNLTQTELLDQVLAHQPELLVVEISSAASQYSLEFCKTLIQKMPSTLIVAVGADVSERHQYYVSQNSIFPFIIRGEFELEVCSLIEQLQQTPSIKDIENFYRNEKNQMIFTVDSLNTLPQIEWSREEADQYIYRYPLKIFRKIVSGYISTSRGCCHNCTFCSPSVRKSFGKKLRFRDAHKVVDEIEYLQQMGVNIISIEDDDFTGNKDHVRSICHEIGKRNIHINWTCHARVDEVNADLLTLMRKAGCVLILFGVESGSKKILQKLNKASSKTDWEAQTMRVFTHCRNVGIATCAMFLVGNPQETLEDVEKSISLAIRLRPDFIKVHNFTLYPGSLDYQKYHQQSQNDNLQHHYSQPNLNLSNMPSDELQKIQRVFYKRFFSDPSFILSHLRHYALFYFFNFRWSFGLIKDVLMFLLLKDNSQKDQSEK